MVHCKKNIKICRATECDRPDIEKFLRDVFFKTEPSSLICGVDKKDNVSEELLELVTRPVCEGMSFIAVNEQRGKERVIAGVAVNGVKRTVFNDEAWEESAKNIKCQQERELLLLWRQLSKLPCDPREHFGCVEELVETEYLSVMPQMQRQGIAKALLVNSLEEAGAKGYCFLRMDCTSVYSAALAEKTGMRKICEVYYKELRDSDGNRYKNVEPPHIKAAVFIADTSKRNC